jgi:hypothetical protein
MTRSFYDEDEPRGFGSPRRPNLTLTKVAAALVAIIVVGVAILEFNSYSRTDGGTVMVIRNGGALDNTKIRQVLPINSPRERTGWFSDEHPYPAQGRYYWVTGNPGGGDAAGAVNVWLKTADGVNVGAIGQFQFTLNTDLATTYDPANPFTLRDDPATPDPTPVWMPNLLPRDKGGASLIEIFDNKFGTREYPVSDNPATEDKEDGEAAPWDGDKGWNAWLDSQARPQMLGAFNQIVGGTRCVQINPACALVVQSTQAEQDAAANAAAAGTPAAVDNTTLLRQFENRIADALRDNMTRNMGGPFFSNITFGLTRVPLDPAVDQQIGQAQAKFAERSAAIAQGQKDKAEADARKAVAETDANARLAVANTDAQANAKKQEGYNACGTCADVDKYRAKGDMLKNLPPNTTLAGDAGVLLTR